MRSKASGFGPACVLVSILAAAEAVSGAEPHSTLRAAWEPAGKGRIIVTWTLPQEAAGGAATLHRTHADLRPSRALDPSGDPLVAFPLPPGELSGRLEDSLVAHGRAYSYYVRARGRDGRPIPGPVARARVPERALAPGACDPGCHLFVDKRHYVLEVNRGETCLKRYPIGLGADPVKRKLHQDNRTTPEGSYRVAYLKPRSQFHKAYGIDYPNAEDRRRYARAREAGTLPADRPDIGGAVQIHGGGSTTNWTWGCMALENGDIDELFAQEGIRAGTAIFIAGSEVQAQDLRRLARAPAGAARVPRTRSR